MPSLLAEIVDVSALLETVAAAFVGGVGVTFAFSLAILGATRFAELRREDRLLEAGVFGLLGAVALAVTVAAIVIGVIVMASK